MNLDSSCSNLEGYENVTNQILDSRLFTANRRTRQAARSADVSTERPFKAGNRSHSGLKTAVGFSFPMNQRRRALCLYLASARFRTVCDQISPDAWHGRVNLGPQVRRKSQPCSEMSGGSPNRGKTLRPLQTGCEGRNQDCHSADNARPQRFSGAAIPSPEKEHASQPSRNLQGCRQCVASNKRQTVMRTGSKVAGRAKQCNTKIIACGRVLWLTVHHREGIR
jgi:hypothetical protein